MSDSPATRISLILRLRNSDDAEAWSEFVEIYQPLIIRLAQKKGLQQADALDLSQEVLGRIARTINEWDPDPNQGSFRGWIATITRNLVIDFLRKAGKQPWTAGSSSVQELLQSQSEPTIESQWFDLERERQLFAWAAEKVKPTVNEATWQAFWLTAVESKDVDTVAQSLNISRGAVYISRSRVMTKLRNAIERSETNLFDNRGLEQ